MRARHGCSVPESTPCRRAPSASGSLHSTSVLSLLISQNLDQYNWESRAVSKNHCGTQHSYHGQFDRVVRVTAGLWVHWPHAGYACSDYGVPIKKLGIQSCISAGSCHLELVGLCKSDGEWPDGTSIVPWKKGTILVWDVTCASWLLHQVRQELWQTMVRIVRSWNTAIFIPLTLLDCDAQSFLREVHGMYHLRVILCHINFTYNEWQQLFSGKIQPLIVSCAYYHNYL